MSTLGNGTQVVNINAPSQAGVSHKVYTQFDVSRPGVVLNNATTATATSLAGQVAANANLGVRLPR